MNTLYRLTKMSLFLICCIAICNCGSEQSGADDRGNSANINNQGNNTNKNTNQKPEPKGNEDKNANVNKQPNNPSNPNNKPSTKPQTNPANTQAKLQNFIPIVADAICRKITNHCNQKSQTEFFRPILASEELSKKYKNSLPPIKKGLTHNDCVKILSDVLEVRPFGKWIKAAKTSQVMFNEKGFDLCLSELKNAKSGADTEKALYDSQCFAYQPPMGGKYQRKMFDRTAAAGDSCSLLNDGFGGLYYGTCNAAVSYCCYNDQDKPGSCSVFPAKYQKGTCAKASIVGGRCGYDFKAQRRFNCQTGLECNSKGFCEKPISKLIDKGSNCYDSKNYKMLGYCKSGFYCDMLGTKSCENKIDLGQTCTGSEQCKSTYCLNKVCSSRQFCSGL